MSYRIEKSTGDLVIEGFEKGIAPSPYLGMGDMKCLNISTEPTEASVNYVRTQLDQTAIVNGSLNYQASNLVSYIGATPLKPGMWINVSDGGGIGLGTGLYMVLSVESGILYKLSATYATGGIVSGLNAGNAATFSTVDHFTELVARAVDLQTTSTYPPPTYFMMDLNGVILFYNSTYASTVYPSTPNNWVQLTATGPSTGGATGMEVFNGYVFRFYISTGSATPVVDYATVASILNGSFTTFTRLGNLLSTNTHQAFSGHDNTLYYTDGQYISSIAPTFQPVGGYWTYDGSTTNLILTITNGTNLVNGMPVIVDTTATMPSGGQLQPSPVVYYTTNVGSVINSQVQSLAFTGAVSSGSTSKTLAAKWPYPTTVAQITFSDGEKRMATFTNDATTCTWTDKLGSGAGLANTVTANFTVGGPTQTFELSLSSDGSSPITPTGTYTGILTFTSVYFNPGIAGSITWNKFALQLPAFETAQCLAELGTNLMIGGATNNLYPWDRSSTTATTTTTSSFFYPILLPENNVVQLVTVNNVLYVFCGNKGNIYITNGSSASLALTIPDYITGQIEPYYTWGATMYVRGRIWFSVTAANCGGVWSFVPTLNQVALGQDVGTQLRLENQNSYGTYSGVASVLLPNQSQASNGVQYWAGWFNGTSTYGLDGSGTTPLSSPGLVETDAIPTGTLLDKKSFSQVEYKLATALVSGESVQLYYRQDLGFNSSGAWVSLGTVIKETSSPLSGYFVANFQNTQWLQIRAVLTSTDTNPTFVRLKEIRIR